MGSQVYGNRKDRAVSTLHQTSPIRGLSILPHHQRWQQDSYSRTAPETEHQRKCRTPAGVQAGISKCLLGTTSASLSIRQWSPQPA